MSTDVTVDWLTTKKTLVSWCQGDPCDPCKGLLDCIVPPTATVMGETICYWIQQSPTTGGSVGCGYRDTNLLTGVVTITPGTLPDGSPGNFPPNPPIILAGQTLIVSSTLGWATLRSGLPVNQGQQNFPDVSYTGTGDPVVDAAGVSQVVNQATTTMEAAACVARQGPL